MLIGGKEGFLTYDGKEGDGKEGEGKEGDGKEDEGKEGEGREGDGREGDGKEGEGKEGDVLQLGLARIALFQGRHRSSESDPSLGRPTPEFLLSKPTQQQRN